MKKILLGISLVSSVFATDNIKTNNTFVSVEYGQINAKNERDNYAGFRLGTYCYMENIYKINNRIYLSGGKVFAKNGVKFYKTKASFDWIWTQTTLKPFLGLSLGYISYKDKNKKDYSVGTKGLEGGLLYYFGNNIELEAGASLEKSLSKPIFWNKTIKKGYFTINYSF